MLRRCDTVTQYDAYVKEKLNTPDKIAWWIQQNIFPVIENPPVWFSVEACLKTKEGNCTELACLGKRGLNLLPGYRSEIMVLNGIDKYGERKAHAIAAFEHNGKRGWIEGGVKAYSDLPWRTLAPMVRTDWVVTEKYR